MRPEVVTNAAKASVWRAKNFAFDRTVATDTFGGLNLGLSGQYFDVETGSWYNVNRDYDAVVGRYLQSDPIGLGAGVNPYTYATNRPTNLADALGLATYPYSFVGPLDVDDTRCALSDADAIQSVFPEGYALGGGRLAYAGLARAIPILASVIETRSLVEEAMFANAARNSLKDIFRLGLFQGARQPSFEDLYAKYGGNISQIIKGSASTNAAYNTLGAIGAGLAAAGDARSNGEQSTCDCNK